EQRPGDRGRNPVLASAGLGDQPRLSHALCQHGLGEHLVSLVGAAMEQILALEIELARQVAAAGQRCWPSGIIREQAVELRGERRVVLSIEERPLQLLERRHEYLGHKAAAEAAEATAQAHALSRWRDTGRRASNSAA